MNKRPTITVLFKENDVPLAAIRYTFNQIYGGTFWESSIVKYEGDRDEIEFEVVNDSDIPEDKLSSVLSCVRDHIENVDRENLETEYYDQSCVHYEHIAGKVGCHASLEDCKVVDIYGNDYTADDVKVRLFYVRLA